MRVCPKCRTIVAEHVRSCGVCGADLGDIEGQSVEQAVRAEELAEAVDTGKLDAKSLALGGRRAIVRVVLFIVLVGMVVSGFLLLSTTDSTQAFVALLLMMIGLAGILWVGGRTRVRRPRRLLPA